MLYRIKNIDQILFNLQHNKKLVFSFLWILFITFQHEMFFGLIGELKAKIFGDNDILLPLAIIEYLTIVTFIFAPVIAFNFYKELYLSPFSLFDNNSNTQIPYIRYITLSILFLVPIGVFLASCAELDLIKNASNISHLATRLKDEFLSTECYQFLLSYLSKHDKSIITLTFAFIPLIHILGLFLPIHIAFLIISAFPIISCLLITINCIIVSFDKTKPCLLKQIIHKNEDNLVD